jgi:hypothetical protein
MPGGAKTRNWELAAAALAAGQTVAQAAEAAGVDERTVYRWRRKEAFAEREWSLRHEIVDGAIARLAQHMTRAVDRIAKLIDHKNPALALRAALATIQTVAPFHQIARETRDTIRAVEKHLAEEKKWRAERDAHRPWTPPPRPDGAPPVELTVESVK